MQGTAPLQGHGAGVDLPQQRAEVVVQIRVGDETKLLFQLDVFLFELGAQLITFAQFVPAFQRLAAQHCQVPDLQRRKCRVINLQRIEIPGLHEALSVGSG